MKIAIFTNTFAPHVGGVANSVGSLVDLMRERGHRCLVIAPDFPDQPDSEEDVIRVPSIQNFNGSDFSFRLPSGTLIGDRIKAFQPDVIHTHHPFLLGDAGLRMAHQWSVPLVFTHHTRYEDYVHYLVDDSELLERLAVELATEYGNLCDRIIAPSESIEELIKGRGVKVPITVILTGIDEDQFASGEGSRSRKRYGISEDRFVIGHVGRLAPEKNLKYLFKAVFPFMRENPDTAFMVVGKGDSYEDLKKMADGEDFRDRIHFIGKLTRQDLVDAYHAMDLFVFSSKSETQGMVLAEAMAAGKPVVALDAPGVREIVRDGKNGRMLAEDASTDDFRKAIGEMKAALEDKPDAFKEALAKSAHAFSTEVCMDRMEQTYQELIETKRRESDMPGWTRFISRMEAEWDLALGRARAVGAAFKKAR
jgi:glycosyltransferase involved in cell wall biosynthesis